MFPGFDEDGNMPPGIYPATLAETLAYFGQSPFQRWIVGQRLARIHGLAQGTGHLFRFVVYGSFVTAKAAPNDVDVFILMEDGFDAG